MSSRILLTCDTNLGSLTEGMPKASDFGIAPTIHENGWREGHTGLVGVNKVTFTVYQRSP